MQERIREKILLSAYQSFGIKNSTSRIRRCLILGGISDKTFSISKCDIRWSNSIALVICNYLNLSIDVGTDARICGTQIDPDHRAKFFTGLIPKR